jgi:hypothetical protein
LLKIHDYSRSSAQRNQIQANNAAIDLELKKIGIALQQISKRLSNRPLVSGSVRIRTIDMNATNNAYTMIFEYHGLAAEVHTDVPVPKDIDFNKITVQQQAPQPAPALDMSIIVTDLQKGPTKSVFIQANKRNNPVRIIPLQNWGQTEKVNMPMTMLHSACSSAKKLYNSLSSKTR